ncbi:MAG: uncharacterized protein QOK21_3872 [Solirubrobacteraceae bacterium]|jgi:uncharacterized protein Yka (UPF0111/DUF47 family)|nr:uncharacterized protein [Solirubrobacteraceae bacterium]
MLALFEAAGDNNARACVLLRDLLAGFPEQAELATAIRDREHEGDRLAHEMLLRLADHGARACALEATDVHALTGALDDVVDFAEEAADQLGLYGVEATTVQSLEMAEVLVLAAREVLAALRDLSEGNDLSGRLVEIHRLENQADRIVRGAVATLFAQGIDPMVVIRWKAIYDTLEAAVDACETVANVLEGIALKQAAGH